VPGTNGWENWTTVTCEIKAVSGITQKLYLLLRGSGYGLLNIDWIAFVSEQWLPCIESKDGFQFYYLRHPVFTAQKGVAIRPVLRVNKLWPILRDINLYDENPFILACFTAIDL
jgi:hypothetical protein